MSPAFIKGITEHLGCPPEEGADSTGIGGAGHAESLARARPQIVFDRYHVVAKAKGIVAWQHRRISNGLSMAPIPWSKPPNAEPAATDPSPR